MISINICYPKSELNKAGDPLPVQKDFHLSNKKFRMLEGGWGTGKTTAICLELSKDIQISNNYILFGRKDLQEFKSTTLKEFLDIYEPIIWEHNKQDRTIKFSNGAEIYYTNLDDSRDALNKIASLNLGAAVIDQAEEITRLMFETIKGRLRRKNTRRVFYGAANPNGHDWIWEDFISMPFNKYALKNGLETAVQICNELDKTHYADLEDKYKEIAAIHNVDTLIIQTLHKKFQYQGFIATSLDNPYLPNDTLQTYLNLPEKVKKRYVFCSFDDFTGNVYSDFTETNEIGFYEPSDQERLCIVLDYGYRNPTAVGFFAIDYEGIARLYDEIYLAETPIREIANLIKQHKGWERAYKLADPSIFNTQQDGRSIADDYLEEGITFLKANNEVRQGIQKVNELLKEKRLLISKNCVNWFEERDRYVWKDLKPGMDRNEYEEPVKKNDHLMDMTRYFVNYIYEPKRKSEEEKSREEIKHFGRKSVIELQEETTWTTF